MESQALHPGKSSTSRRLLVVAVLLATLVGLSLLARRTGLISWDLQPVVQGIAQPIQIDTNLPARLTDAPPPTGLMPQLRPTNATGSGDILPVMPRAKPIVDIALAAGFCDQSHFTRTFKRAIGVAPSQYRESLRGA